MKKLFLKTMMLTAALVFGVGQSWAESTTIYERGGSGTAWSDADLSVWSSGSIDGGLKQSGTNGDFSSSMNLSVENTSIITLQATLTGGVASGRSGSYDYITIGGVSLRLYGQDSKASIVVDGTETSLSGFTRNGSYTLSVTIDQAKNKASYTISGATSGSASDVTTTTKVTNVEVGHYKEGRENYEVSVILNSIAITEEKQTVSVGSYTVNYLCGETVIKEATVGEGVVGENVVVPHNPIWFEDNKYIYVSDNTETTPITAEGITINVQYRLADTYSYTFSSNVGTWSASGSVFEGETAKAYVPRYIVVGTTAYLLDGIDKTKNNIEYSKSATIESDGQNITVNYNEFANNVVYFNEGEDIYAEKYTGAPSRTSMGTAGAIENEKVVTTLAPGKYKLYCASHCANSSSGATVTYLVGGNSVLEQTPKGYLALEYNGVEFTVNTSSDLIITQEGNAAGLDYVLIEKTGDVVAVTDLGWASYCSPSNLTIPADIEAYYASNVGTESVTLTALNAGDVVPAGFGMLIKAAEGNYTFNIAATSTVSVDNQLSGTLVETATADLKKADTDKIYVLGNVDGAKLCNFTGDNVPANKAYLRVAKAVNSAPMRFVFEDEATGISQTMTEVKMSNGQSYNLQGQKVAADYKGIVIMNGKKVVMK